MFKRDNNAGIYLTIAFHLLLLIIFLGVRIDSCFGKRPHLFLILQKKSL